MVKIVSLFPCSKKYVKLLNTISAKSTMRSGGDSKKTVVVTQTYCF